MPKITKRLLIRLGTCYDNDDKAKIVPVNTGIASTVDSAIGTFSVMVNIPRFDGSKPHRNNSCYDIADSLYLNGEPANGKPSMLLNDWEPNFRLHVTFTPHHEIKALQLLFGNDFTVPIRDHVPAIPLATGLKFFSWFINKSAKGDVYGDKPYLYGLAINSFSYIDVNPQKPPHVREREYTRTQSENMNLNVDNTLKIPTASLDRKKFFGNTLTCDDFVFHRDCPYTLQFDTTSLKIADSVYAVSIPTYGSRTFDFMVSSYANEHLNNFNWTIKEGGYEGVGHGKLGMVLNFSLLDEEN